MPVRAAFRGGPPGSERINGPVAPLRPECLCLRTDVRMWTSCRSIPDPRKPSKRTESGLDSKHGCFPQFSWRIRTCDHAGSRALMVTHVHDPRRGPVRSGPRATNSHISPILGRAARLQADYPDRTYGSVKPCGRLSFAWRRRSRERRHRKGQPEPRPESPAAGRGAAREPGVVVSAERPAMKRWPEAT